MENLVEEESKKMSIVKAVDIKELNSSIQFSKKKKKFSEKFKENEKDQ